MGLMINCGTNPDGSPQMLEVNSVGGGGNDPQYPNLMAQKINLTMMDVQQTIMEGRATDTRPFNIFGATGLSISGLKR